ncbi:MAG: spermidine/putrescine ABC transporter substrate-binding protein [Gaiellales bacterium]|jgi:spermidine/putrescine transport system substrate-binding protein
MTERHPDLNILAPITTRPRLDRLERLVRRSGGGRMTRADALGLGGLALLAAAGCGGKTSTGGGGAASSSGGTDPLAGKPMEGNLVIYNWSQYDDPSTYKSFKTQNHVAIKETYYSSNDELLAKLQAGGTGYDIIVPSQNAVGELVQLGSLMKLDKALIPNASAVESSWVKTAYDPTGDYKVVKDFGVTMFFYNNKIVTEKPTTMKQFYDLLPKYGKVGRTNLMDGAEEVVPLALMALGYDPNTGDSAELDKAKSFLLSIRSGVTTIDSSNYINDASAGKIILGQGWNGDVRRIVSARKKQGDITAVLPMDTSEKWADNWCIPATAPDPVAAHGWINHLCNPAVAVTEMEYHNYPIPIQAALDQTPAELKNDPLFNVPTSYTDHYKFILNPSQEIVNARTQIYTAFQSA